MTRIAIAIALLVAVILLGSALFPSDRGRPANPLVVGADAPSATVMDFSSDLQLDPPQEGWFHRTFVMRTPMQISLARKDGVPALRCETDASGSIFGRYTDIDIRKLPKLRWSWMVEKPISTAINERFIAGDDHPVRLFLRFADSEGQDHTTEIIWSSGSFKPGDYKYIMGFPHYVAQSGYGDIGRWIEEEVDLVELYEKISGRSDDARLTIVAVFCDTDDTFASSIAYLSSIEMGSASR
jgi:hypothetical protein